MLDDLSVLDTDYDALPALEDCFTSKIFTGPTWGIISKSRSIRTERSEDVRTIIKKGRYSPWPPTQAFLGLSRIPRTSAWEATTWQASLFLKYGPWGGGTPL